MTQANRATVEMHFADGTVIDSWLSYSLHESFTDPLGSFELTTAPPRARIREYRDRLAKGELVSILLNGARQGSFLINDVKRSVDAANGVEISVRCTTVLVTPYEGGVDPKLSLSSQTDVGVTDAILAALGPYGFTNIIGDSSTSVQAISGKPIGNRRAAVNVDALKHSEAHAQDGQSAYEFAKSIITRLGAVLRVDVDGTLLATSPDYDQDASATIVQSFGATTAPDGDHALSLTAEDSNSGQFSEVISRGLASDKAGTKQSSEPKSTVASTAISATRPLYKSSAAPFKPKHLKDKHSASAERCASIAKLAMTMRAEQAYCITVEVDGALSRTGRLWAIDTIARVYSDLEDIDEDMWLLDRTVRGDRQGGQKTTLKFIPKGALNLGDLP